MCNKLQIRHLSIHSRIIFIHKLFYGSIGPHHLPGARVEEARRRYPGPGRPSQHPMLHALERVVRYKLKYTKIGQEKKEHLVQDTYYK